MSKNLLIVIVIVSIVVNLLLLKQNFDMHSASPVLLSEQTENCLFPDSSFLIDSPDGKQDIRGLYSMGGFGKYLIPPTSENPAKAPFSLAVFLSAKTVGDKNNCIPCLQEFEVYKRLDSLFRTRNQQLLFVAERPDSSVVASYLKQENMNNELLISSPDSSLSFYQIGISYRSMPFKIVYDSNFNAIYMRGANSTLANQLEFENAVSFLSDVAVGEYY